MRGLLDEPGVEGILSFSIGEKAGTRTRGFIRHRRRSLSPEPFPSSTKMERQRRCPPFLRTRRVEFCTVFSLCLSLCCEIFFSSIPLLFAVVARSLCFTTRHDFCTTISLSRTPSLCATRTSVVFDFVSKGRVTSSALERYEVERKESPPAASRASHSFSTYFRSTQENEEEEEDTRR